MGFIYRLTSPSGKTYIGQTICPIEERLRGHKKKSSGCVAIYNAIQHHGWENMTKEWYEVPDEDLNFYEEMLVALLGTLAPGGYNLREGGGSGGKMSEESRRKMSEAQRGEKSHLYGKPMSDDRKQKIGIAQKGEKHHYHGKTLSDEHKRKLSDANKGENHSKSKKVYQYKFDGTFLQSFPSTGEAARSLNKGTGSKIRACARGERKTMYGFKWSYIEL
ncbi:GIY-YIG catalytic domain-containing endonuclease [Acanthocystis turfacea Chlorella virus NTS-1]|nr:GIY-YIG catalytic domain-containing endonuclease [Acanthocystis turfacea Chlorella virus NTS-1]